VYKTRLGGFGGFCDYLGRGGRENFGEGVAVKLTGNWKKSRDLSLPNVVEKEGDHSEDKGHLSREEGVCFCLLIDKLQTLKGLGFAWSQDRPGITLRGGNSLIKSHKSPSEVLILFSAMCEGFSH